MEYCFVTGHRKNSKLLYLKTEKYLFFKKDSYKNKINFQCYEKECHVRVSLLDNICIQPLNSLREHNHENHEKLYEMLKIKNCIKRKCGDVNEMENSRNIRDIFNTECEK